MDRRVQFAISLHNEASGASPGVRRPDGLEVGASYHKIHDSAEKIRDLTGSLTWALVPLQITGKLELSLVIWRCIEASV